MKKRKKFNPLKQAKITADYYLKHYCVGSVMKQPVKLIYKPRMQIVPMSKQIFSLFSRFRYNWSVYIAAFGIDANGKKYMKSEQMNFKDPYFHAELTDVLNQYHSRLIAEFNPTQLLSVGWLATTYPYDFDEKQAFLLFEKIGAFNFVKLDNGDIVEDDCLVSCRSL